MNVLRYVNMGFVVTGLLTWVVMAEGYAAMFEWVAPTWDRALLGPDFIVSDLLGLVTGLSVGVYLWRKDTIRTASFDIATELSRVTWPKWDETRVNTFVVMVVTVVVSLILGFFDYLWAWLTSQIYGV